MEDVIVAGMLPQVLAKLVEGGRTQNVHVRRQLLGLNQLNQRASDGTITHIVLKGTADDQQDVDAIVGEIGGGLRTGKLVEVALQAPLVREVAAGLRIVQCLPGPGENVGIVGSNLQDGGVAKPIPGIATVEERVESLRSPGAKGVEDVVGVIGFRMERVVEKLFQIPAQLAHERRVGTAFHRELVR
jgi:hypothetical protein